mmetsp:Transcript_17846/g.15754  ORF Transcript_17846/g.15754 Transcript_17846/m.15754 type:complete len:403 (-) Transcript_17846:10-1218(-)
MNNSITVLNSINKENDKIKFKQAKGGDSQSSKSHKILRSNSVEKSNIAQRRNINYPGILTGKSSQNNMYDKFKNNYLKIQEKPLSNSKSNFPFSIDGKQRSLETQDISGAYPSWNSKMNKKKIFIDKSQIREVFGQKIGNYHGFKEDYSNGGTYNPNPRNNIFVKDIDSYVRFKNKNKSNERRNIHKKVQRIDLKNEINKISQFYGYKRTNQNSPIRIEDINCSSPKKSSYTTNFSSKQSQSQERMDENYNDFNYNGKKMNVPISKEIALRNTHNNSQVDIKTRNETKLLQNYLNKRNVESSLKSLRSPFNDTKRSCSVQPTPGVKSIADLSDHPYLHNPFPVLSKPLSKNRDINIKNYMKGKLHHTARDEIKLSSTITGLQHNNALMEILKKEKVNLGNNF